jgi:hypothetical protein
MTRDELLKSHNELTKRAYELMKRKNADYAGKAGTEPFANFTRCEAMGICTTEAGMLVRMTDKLSRLSSFVEAGTFQVKDESLEDTCVDIINYAVLFHTFVQDKKNSNRKD